MSENQPSEHDPGSTSVLVYWLGTDVRDAGSLDRRCKIWFSADSERRPELRSSRLGRFKLSDTLEFEEIRSD